MGGASPPAQQRELQSLLRRHFLPDAHFGQRPPPQSTSVSVPSIDPFPQVPPPLLDELLELTLLLDELLELTLVLDELLELTLLLDELLEPTLVLVGPPPATLVLVGPPPATLLLVVAPPLPRLPPCPELGPFVPTCTEPTPPAPPPPEVTLLEVRTLSISSMPRIALQLAINAALETTSPASAPTSRALFFIRSSP
jgi:hypothetical protein